MTQNKALMRVTYELLLDALGLPDDVRILAVTQQPEDILVGAFRLVIEHPDLPLHAEGATPPTLTADQVIDAIGRVREFA